MAKTGKSEPKVAEHWFSRIIRKEMFLNIPIIFNSPILLLTYYCNCFWKKNCPVLSLFCCFLIKISVCCLFKSLVNWERSITITLIWYYPYLLRNCWIRSKERLVGVFTALMIHLAEERSLDCWQWGTHLEIRDWAKKVNSSAITENVNALFKKKQPKKKDSNKPHLLKEWITLSSLLEILYIN